MTIDKTIEFFNGLECHTPQAKDARDVAVDTMRKYQKLEQEPKTGHWKEFIHDAYHGTDEYGNPIWRKVTVYHCSQCNRRTVIKEKFCPRCGAKMV